MRFESEFQFFNDYFPVGVILLSFPKRQAAVRVSILGVVIRRIGDGSLSDTCEDGHQRVVIKLRCFLDGVPRDDVRVHVLLATFIDDCRPITLNDE